MSLCRHCFKRPGNRRRGLCRKCYESPEIRERYQPNGIHARRGGANHNEELPLPPFSTCARPGSPEKIAVFEQRISQGFNLWHPGDATLEDNPFSREAG